MLRLNRSFLLIAALALALPAAGGEVVEMIAARINSEVVTLSELKHSRETLRQELAQRYSGLQLQAELATREKDLLRDLIDNSLLLQKGKEMGLNVDTEVVKRLDRIRRDMGLANMEDLEKAIAESGVSYEDYKAQIRNNLITQQVIGRDVGSRVQVTQDEVKKFYEEHKKELERPEQVRLREVLVSTEGKEGEALEAAEKKAKDLLARLRKGEKFEELAQKESEGASARSGGDIGFFRRGVMAKEIEDMAFKLKKGEISDLIRIKNGFLILKVEDHQAAGIPPLAEVEPEIQEQIYLRKMQPALRQYLTKLREEAYLEIKQGYVDSGSPATLSFARLIPKDVTPEEMTTTLSEAKRGGRSILKPWTWPPFPRGGSKPKVKTSGPKPGQ